MVAEKKRWRPTPEKRERIGQMPRQWNISRRLLRDPGKFAARRWLSTQILSP